MCGIFALLEEDAINNDELNQIIKLIDRRGPDHKSGVVGKYSSCGKKLSFYASVLHLRGHNLKKQPLIDDKNNVLLFNGQIYKFANEFLPRDVNDTEFLSQKLTTCKTKSEIIDNLKRIDGPFAFIYWNESLNTLFYGRDIFGRKSLCKLNASEDSNCILLSSVASQGFSRDDRYWSEINSDGFTAVEYESNIVRSTTKFRWSYDHIYPPTHKCREKSDTRYDQVADIECDNLKSLNNNNLTPQMFDNELIVEAIDRLETLLLDAIKTRIAFNRPDCLTCRSAITKHSDCNHTKYGVAFSGGLDSTMLAVGLHKILDTNETIDLLSCAFKNDSPDREALGSAFLELVKICGSRKWRLVLADIDLPDLNERRADIIRHLIWPCKTVIDDSLGIACWFIGRGQGRALTSEDLSNFAEFLRYNPTNQFEPPTIWQTYEPNYVCPASMIFAGSSIDEQLGGYSSHRSAWLRSGSEGLISEISFQMRRLPKRNLGRDDRIYSDHGRDLKLPYLDFDLVSFLNDLPVGIKMDLNDKPEIGTKKILRLLALRWGLEKTYLRIKRAMQFGTRIANLENSKEKGDDICSRLMNLDRDNYF